MKDSNPQRRVQFNLRTLLLAFVFLSACLGLIAWDLTIGALLSTAFAGIVVAVVGIRHRFTAAIVLGFATAAVIAWIFVVDMTGAVIWDGSFTLRFDATVLDEETGDPVPNADIVVERHGWYFEVQAYSPNPRIPTDRHGRTAFPWEFPCGGDDSAYGITRSSWNEIDLDRYALCVTADGYEQVRVNLGALVGKKEWPMGIEQLPPIVVHLPRDETGLSRLPEVASVSAIPDSSKASLCIIHICDKDHVDHDSFVVKLKKYNRDITDDEVESGYADHIQLVEQVQVEQMAAIRHLIAKYGTKRVFVDGLSPNGRQIYKTRLSEWKQSDQLYRAGAASRLYLSSELKEVAPLDSNGFEERYNPGQEGEIDYDERLIEQREDEQLSNLQGENGIVVLLLGGAHNLADNIERSGRDWGYVRVETKTYAQRVVAEGGIDELIGRGVSVVRLPQIRRSE